jgi:hypothetical protein
MSNSSETYLIEVLEFCIQEGHFSLAKGILDQVENTFSLYDEYIEKIDTAILNLYQGVRTAKDGSKTRLRGLSRS